MAKLYTGFGDSGFTQTLTDKHIKKSDNRICLVGTLDEFSAVLGVAKAHLPDGTMKNDIETVQSMLIAFMGELAGGEICADKNTVCRLEKLTDKYSGEFSGFAIPGKKIPSAYLNLARCVIRRAERIAAELLSEDKIRKDAYCCLNRLSDLMYAMSRYAEEI